jgi:hypothetical protein
MTKSEGIMTEAVEQLKSQAGASEERLMRGDVIVDDIRRVRDDLVKRHGGLDGWIQHLQAMDRERARKSKRTITPKQAPNARKGRAQQPRSTLGK